MLAQSALVVTCAVLICLGTLASRSTVVAALAMAVVGFAILFAGVVSSVLAGATTSLLLAFILPVSLPGPVSSIPDRVAGWGLAGVGLGAWRSRCCGRRPRAIRCGWRRSTPAGRWRSGCGPRSRG